MRKVSYTQMRAELSDILDAIRNGETVIVTQRGRPDTVLNGSLIEPGSSIKTDDYGSRITAPDGKTIIATGGKVIRVTFDQALLRTQHKHAKIIKALEDK